MRKIGWLVSAVLVITVCLAGSVFAAEGAGTSAPKPAVAAEAAQAPATVPFEPAWAWKKVGARLQAAWLSAKGSGNMDQRFDCFVRVETPYDDGDRSFLQSNGFNVQVNSGPIVRGNTTAGALPSVAQLPFVQSIELSSK